MEYESNLDAESEWEAKEQPPTVFNEQFSVLCSRVSQLYKYVPSKMETSSLAEAASRINPSHLKSFLDSSPKWTWSHMMHFVDYFDEALSGLSSSSLQFPWTDMDKLMDWIDFPMSQIPKAVYETSACWIRRTQPEALRDFVTWSFDFIRRLVGRHPAPPKTHVGVVVVLAMVLHARPLTLMSVLPSLRDETKYFPHMLPLIVWMFAQASQANLAVALFSWVHNLLPLLGTCDPHSVDLILQLAECIVSSPDARSILLMSAFQKPNSRFIPPPSFEILLQLTFPASADRVKDTKRLEAIYPLLKEMALAPAPGRGQRTMKQVIHPIFTLSLKLAGHPNPVLAKEAISIAKWCLTNSIHCCNLWDQAYKKNLKASVALLKNLVDHWDNLSIKICSPPSDALILDRTIKTFMLKNKKFGVRDPLYKVADKYSKEISGRLCNIPNDQTMKTFMLKSKKFGVRDSVYIEADKYCKVISGKLRNIPNRRAPKKISGKLHRGNVFLRPPRVNGFIKDVVTGAITAVILVALVAAALVLTSNLRDLYEL